MATLLQAKNLCANIADCGLKLGDPRLVARINEAQRRLVKHYNFVVRREEYDEPQITWVELTSDTDELLLNELDATKLMVLALYREENNALDMAGPLEKRAQELVTESVITNSESNAKAAWQWSLSAYTPGTFGHTKARIGLDLYELSLRLTNSRIGRYVNSAEEALMMKGKAVGTIEELRFDVAADGTILLPATVEAVLYAAMGDIPAPVYRQSYDWLENGPGYQVADGRGWAAVMVARGEVDGKRCFFVRNPVKSECVRVLVKKRFVPKTDPADAMTVRNYHALREMVTALALAAIDPQKSELHEQKALRLIDQELAEYRGGERAKVGFEMKGAGGPPRRMN